MKVDKDKVLEARPKPIKVTKASEIEMKRPRWIWDGWLPLGAICLCAGFEDQGKSTWSLELGARITRGQLAGEFKGKPASVGVQATEDDWASIIVPRLVAAGADLDRVYRIDDVLSLQRDAKRIGELVEEFEFRLVILDPVVTRMDGAKDSNNYTDVRNELESLGRVLQETGCTLLGLTHFNKGNGPIENRIIGSRAWRAVVRSVVLVVEDLENEGDRLLVHNKCNYGTKQKTVRFAIRGETVGADPRDGKPIVAPHIAIKGTSELTDVEAIAAIDGKHARKGKTETERCEEWLMDRLGQDPVLSKTVKDEARALGFNERTVNRAAANVRVTREGGGPGTTWRLMI